MSKEFYIEQLEKLEGLVKRIKIMLREESRDDHFNMSTQASGFRHGDSAHIEMVTFITVKCEEDCIDEEEVKNSYQKHNKSYLNLFAINRFVFSHIKK